MKGIIVREMASLSLRPASTSASTTQAGGTHLKFSNGKSASKAKGAAKHVPEKKDLQHEHAKYYAVITCNQIVLTPSAQDREVAVQLINIYFELFKEILGQNMKVEESVAGDDPAEAVDHSRLGKEKKRKQEQKGGKGKGKDERIDGFAEVEDGNSKFISAILTGVNRALPFAKLGLEDVE